MCIYQSLVPQCLEDTPQQEDLPHPSPKSSISTAVLDISPSSYLTVPNARPARQSRSLPRPSIFAQDDIEVQYRSTFFDLPQILLPSGNSTPTGHRPSASSRVHQNFLANRVYMSIYSASSVETDYSEYSNPPARSYGIPNFEKMGSSRKISTAEKEQYIHALRTHQINTLVELRRIEKSFAVLGTPDCSEPMTSAWSYYVDTNSLLTELRGLTRNYPFSSDCLDEAKRRVYSDPASNRSWNLCWLVLSKAKNDQLVPYYARYQASLPAMWGGHTPTSEQITQLTNAFVAEWNYAIGQLLRHWEQPPTR